MTGAVPPEGRLIAIDWGTKRIGLAVSDPSQTIAQPLATLTRRVGRRFPLRELRSHLETQQVVGCVVGLPLDAAGAEGQATQAARQVGELVRAKTGLPVAYLDERMTTARARNAVRELGGRPGERPEEVDRLAATVLLQAFLDSRRGA